MKRVFLSRQIRGWVFLGLVSASLAGWAETFTPVQTEVVRLETGQESRRFVGRVDAVSQVDLAFQVGGRLASLAGRPGQVLTQGEVLALLDPVDYQLALRQAEVQLDRARRDRARKAPLLANQSIPQAVYDEAVDQETLAQIALETAQQNLSYTQLSAPFDALLTRRLVEPHTLIQAGTPVMRVQDVTEWRVHISVPEDLIHRIRDPEAYEAWLLLDQGDPLPLSYREHVTEPDRVVQTYQVTLGLARSQAPDLLPGRTVTVEVRRLGASDTPRISLPLAAVTSPHSANDFRVWVVNPESGEVQPRAVEVGRIQHNRIEIRSGLSEGEQVVTRGTSRLTPGLRVRSVQSGQ